MELEQIKKEAVDLVRKMYPFLGVSPQESYLHSKKIPERYSGMWIRDALNQSKKDILKMFEGVPLFMIPREADEFIDRVGRNLQ